MKTLPRLTDRQPSRRKEHFKNKSSLASTRRRRRSFQAESVRQRSGRGGLAGRVIGPVAVEAGDAPVDTLAVAGKSAVLDDREIDYPVDAVAGLDVTAAEAPRHVVGLPGPEGDLVDVA